MIRRAEEKDIEKILDLLDQVHKVHSDGRPDLFVIGERKYNEDDIKKLIQTEGFIIFCHVEDDKVDGYAFCKIRDAEKSNGRISHKTLYIDDICVDKNARRNHIGTQLYEHAKNYAKSIGCYHVTLTVWELNAGAKAFYEHLGMKPLETMMEDLL